MITSLMLYSLVLGAWLAAGATLLDWAARRAAMPRRWGWLGALAMLLVLTAIAPWRAADMGSTTGVPSLPNAVVVDGVDAVLPATGLWERVITSVSTWLSLPTEQLLAFVAERVPAALDQAIGWAWGTAALLCLMVTGWALHRLDRQRRAWPRATVLGLPVRVAAHHGPAVYGVLKPDIVLPSALLSRDGSEQQLVLSHEDEHRRARDPLLLALSAIGVSLMPWNPFAWWCAARLRLAVELDCDARVLARGATPRLYGEMLLTLASAISNRRGLVPALYLLDSRRHLERRILAMTARPARRTPLHVAAVLALGSAVVVAACSTDLPTAAQIEEADVGAVTQTLGMVEGVKVAYFIDGQAVSAEQAKALSGDAISSIEVVKKGGAANGAGQVHILTKGNTAETVLEILPKNTAERRAVSDSDVVEMAEQKLAFTVESGDTLRVNGTGTMLLKGDSIGFTNGDGAGTQPLMQAFLQPLMVLDGVVLTGGKRELETRGVSPDRIASVEVIKGPAAVREFGDRAAAGVIRITTKARP